MDESAQYGETNAQKNGIFKKFALCLGQSQRASSQREAEVGNITKNKIYDHDQDI